MVKARMNTADVAAEVKCLRRLIGMRCSNVYDLTPKTYVFKLMNSSGVTESGESEKVLLLMESGVRLHTTAYVRDKSNTPSGFTLKLRKHIRTRRLEDVRQLGYDRIVLFQFGLGVNAHYVILELYAQGNIILTDSEFMVMTLLRSHRDDDKGFAIMSRHHYPIEACRVFQRSTISKLQDVLALKNIPDENEAVEVRDTVDDSADASKEREGKQKTGKSSDPKKNASGPRARQATLKSALGEGLGYGTGLSEHIILDAGLVPNTKLSKDYIIDDSLIHVLDQAVTKFEDWLEEIISGDRIPEGFILLKNKNSGKSEHPIAPQGTECQIFDEYCPLLLNQLKAREFLKFDTFDAALDEFYSKIESQRVEQQQKAKEGSATLKLNKVRVDQENRVQLLRKEVEQSVKMAELIEYNLEDVDAAILAVRVALANGMSWGDLARMVKEEKRSGNPVAGLIDSLHLDRDCITLLLSNNLDEMDDDERTLPVDKVEVDLGLSAHANARRWYERKKRQESKQEKTVSAHEKAFKAAEKKTRFLLSQEKSVAMITHMRKIHWFEKFNWFVSSENYLIISGRDAQQNEMIVKRYMSKGDLYVHAELHGASSTVIKNHKPESPIPPLTLNQAGCFTVCHSQAWDSKIVTSAWWVYPQQVSKTAPTGEYLTVGSFMIRGRKNFLPPHPLIMGFAMLFRLDESSLGAHINERRVRGEEEGINDLDESSNDIEESKFLQESASSSSDSEKETPNENLRNESNSSSFKSGENNKHLLDNTSGVTSSKKDKAAPNPSTTTHEIPIGDKNMSNAVAEGCAGNNAQPQLEDLIDRALELGSAKRYGLESLQADVNEVHDHEERKATVGREKPHISKAERRKIKKGQSGAGDSTSSTRKEDDNTSVSHVDKDVQTVKPADGKVGRGKRGKLKKIKDKYADQDEEERKIRMALLASSGKVQKDDKEQQSGSEMVAIVPKPTPAPVDAPKICYKCKKVGHLSRDCRELDDSLRNRSNGGSETNSLTQLDGGDAKMDRVAMEEDDIHEIGEEEKEKLNDVDFLTGNPLPNDILLYAVPVCAPYTAVQGYKYRVKIVPGTAKKGKAAKTALNLFSHMHEAANREKELMKACTDPELVAAILGNVKITAAGLSQLKQKQKKGKKAGKK